MNKNEMKILKEITRGNCTIVFIEQPHKATDKSIDDLHRDIARILLSEQYAIKKSGQANA